MNVVKNMRVKLLVPALLAAIFAAPAMADDQYSDTARVISATPQTERVNMPRQECRTEYQQQSYNNGDRSPAGALIGGIAGGLLGNTVGRGNGRIAAAAVGAGIGAIAGDRMSNGQGGGGSRSVPVQSCYQVDNWQTVNSGYLVTYEYNGRTYSTVTNNNPGRFIDVNVAISPRSHGVSQVSYNDHHDEDRWNAGWGNDRDGHRGRWERDGRDGRDDGRRDGDRRGDGH